MLQIRIFYVVVAATLAVAGMPALGADFCEGFGPQSPRDISLRAGKNSVIFSIAPKPSEMNLCDIHFHRNAEHKGPGFSKFAGDGKFGGFKCNQSPEGAHDHSYGEAQGEGQCTEVSLGDTIEVHWVYTSCDVPPGPGLGSCLGREDEQKCMNPALRVEAQVFLLVADHNLFGLNFSLYEYGGVVNGYHQPRGLPKFSGIPVSYLGSTTGPKFSDEVCSPLQVSWNVRPRCRPLNFESLNAWCGSKPFEENGAHGVRALVTPLELLSHRP